MSFDQTDPEKLSAQVEKYLKGYLDGLIEWYQYNSSEEWDYVIHVVRRSFMLSTILCAYLEINGKSGNGKLPENTVTDSSIMNYVEEIVDRYLETGRFPRILAADHGMIFGRSLNRLLDTLKKRILTCVAERANGSVPEKVEEDLLSAIWINVYSRTNRSSVLMTGFKSNLRVSIELDMRESRQLTSRISELISYWDIANTAYIYSVPIGNNTVEYLKADGFLKECYQQDVNYTNVDLMTSDQGVQAAFSVRAKKNRGRESYRLIPYTILPELDETESGALLRALDERAKTNEQSDLVGDVFDVKKSICHDRTRSEFVSFVLSVAVLHDLYDQYGKNGKGEIKLIDDDELDKLSVNYRMPGRNAREILAALIRHPLLHGRGEAESLLQTILNKRTVFAPQKPFASIVSREKREVRYDIETAVYLMGARDEHQSMRMQGNYISRSHPTEMLPLSAFLINYTDGTKNSLRNAIAHTQIMMDSGTVNVSVMGFQEAAVAGNQYLRVGELSMLIWPLRIYEYIPVCSLMYRYCTERLIDIKEHLKAYAGSPLSDFADYRDKDIVAKIANFYDFTSLTGETPVEWDISYMSRTESSDPDDVDNNYRLGKALADRREKHVEKYKRYLATL